MYSYVSNQPPNISSRYGLTDIKEFKENKEEHKMVNMKPISDVGSVRGPFRCQRVDASNSLLIFFVFLLLIMNSNLQNLLITHILNIVLRHTCKTNKILNKIH